MSFLVSAAVVGIAGSAYNANAANNARDSAGRIIDASTANANEGQDEYYNTTRADWAPYRETGVDALGRINSIQDGDYSAFEASPGYQWRMDEGRRNSEGAYSSRAGGGNAMRAMEEFRQGLASDEFGNWWNRQNQMVGYGAMGTQNTQVAGQNRANQKSSNFMRTGETQAGLTMYNAKQQAEYVNQGLGEVQSYLKGKI